MLCRRINAARASAEISYESTLAERVTGRTSLKFNCWVISAPVAVEAVYSPTDFDSTGIFIGIINRAIAHEIGGWFDDPIGENQTPA
jgi:hypothetical protein